MPTPKSKPMTKAQIVAWLAEKNGMNKKDVSAFIDTYNELVYAETKKNKKFTLPGIGILKIAKRKARKGRNPATGEEIKIPARTILKITIVKAAKDAVLSK